MARSFPDLTYSQDALTHLEVERVVSSEDGAKCFDSIGIKDSILVDQKKKCTKYMFGSSPASTHSV